MLDLCQEAKLFLEALLPKQYRQVVSKVISLMEDPSLPDSKKLKGNNRYRRVDIGEYRIVYTLEEDCLKIFCIGQRNDAQVFKKPAR